MPKVGRVVDTIEFLRHAQVAPNNAAHLCADIADWLDELADENRITPLIDQGMSQGMSSTEEKRKYRRALILILCALNHIPVASARQAAAQYTTLEQLRAALGATLLDVERIAVPRLLRDKLRDLQTSPRNFLRHNRIQEGRGAAANSGRYECEMIRQWNTRRYFMKPAGGYQTPYSIRFDAYSIAPIPFENINHLDQIEGAQVTGNIALTTELTGCTILYSVNGPNLVAAHVWPHDQGAVRANLPNALAGQAGLSPGALQALRLAHQGGLSNPVVGGTYGLFGMVTNQGEMGLRNVGPNNVRMHGYITELGSAFFIAVRLQGNWRLYTQQNNRDLPRTGVSAFRRIYP